MGTGLRLRSESQEYLDPQLYNTCVVVAQGVAFLPIVFGPDNSLTGEELGTGTVGTTFAISGVSDGS